MGIPLVLHLPGATFIFGQLLALLASTESGTGFTEPTGYDAEVLSRTNQTMFLPFLHAVMAPY